MVPQTVSAPSSASPSIFSATKTITGCRPASRNRAERTLPSRAGLPVRKLAASISTRIREAASGSVTSAVPARMRNAPRTGASPNRCRVRNTTDDASGSMS